MTYMFEITKKIRRSTMSSAPSWKKLCAEGVKNFRRQDIDGALKSFDEVKGVSFTLLGFERVS